MLTSHLNGARTHTTNWGQSTNGHPFTNPYHMSQDNSTLSKGVSFFTSNCKPIHQTKVETTRDPEQVKKLKEAQQKFLEAKADLKTAQQEVIKAEEYLRTARQNALIAGQHLNVAANKFSRVKLAADREDQEVRDEILNIFSNRYCPEGRKKAAKAEANRLIDIILDSKNSPALMPRLDFSKINFDLLCSLATIPKLKIPSSQPGRMITVPGKENPTPQDLVLYIARALNRKVPSGYLDKAVFPPKKDTASQ